MSTTYRIVNPALEPARVEFETGDEQASYREFATRDASAHGMRLEKSDDDGKTWTAIEAQAYTPKGFADHALDDEERPAKPEGGKKAK